MSELKKIAIGDELRPLHYGFAALSQWCEISGLGLNDLTNIGNNISLKNAISLVYVGLKHGARKSKIEFNYSMDDVADWIDTEGMDLFNEVMEIFSEQMAQMTPDSEKKKKTKTK
tara:strand:+ start:212 stop:556 length:345 start_codon:yes stop_codon:yes gene_type:complete